MAPQQWFQEGCRNASGALKVPLLGLGKCLKFDTEINLLNQYTLCILYLNNIL